jgi:hypothetical protein
VPLVDASAIRETPRMRAGALKDRRRPCQPGTSRTRDRFGLEPAVSDDPLKTAASREAVAYIGGAPNRPVSRRLICLGTLPEVLRTAQLTAHLRARRLMRQPRQGAAVSRCASAARPQRAFPARRRKRSHPRGCDGAASHSSTRSTRQASAVHLASARPRLARAGRSGRGCRRRACRGGGRRGP